MKPDRIIVGADNDSVAQKNGNNFISFSVFKDRLICMDIRSAEMTKYAANAMLATKISFINEIANICERVGADANQVRVGMSDQRIGYDFTYPGAGYGGSCFPKDVKALTFKKISLENDYNPQLIKAVEKVNNAQKLTAKKVVNRFGENLYLDYIWSLGAII